MTSNKPNNILVPLDGSPIAEQAIALASILAKPSGKVTLLSVIRLDEGVPEIRLAATISERLEHQTRRYVDDVLLRFRGIGIEIDQEVAFGDPATEILRSAEVVDADLIVMTSHGRGAFGRLRFGSVSDRVSRSANCPVAIVRGDQVGVSGDPVAPKRLVIPFDGSELAAQSLPFASNLAKRLALPVVLVQVIDPVVTRYAAAGTVAMPAEWYVVTQAAMEKEAFASLEAPAAQLKADGLQTESLVLTGPTASALLATIEPTDLVIITSHGRGGIRRWLIGSVAEKLVRCSTAPVVLIPNFPF